MHDKLASCRENYPDRGHTGLLDSGPAVDVSLTVYRVLNKTTLGELSTTYATWDGLGSMMFAQFVAWSSRVLELGESRWFLLCWRLGLVEKSTPRLSQLSAQRLGWGGLSCAELGSTKGWGGLRSSACDKGVSHAQGLLGQGNGSHSLRALPSSTNAWLNRSGPDYSTAHACLDCRQVEQHRLLSPDGQSVLQLRLLHWRIQAAPYHSAVC